jgi:hypothetical protein
MVIAKPALRLYEGLKMGGDPAFRDGASMCDLGAQIMKVGKGTPLHKSPAGDYCKKEYGFARHVSIDMNGANGALPLDLNFATAEEVGETFDVVTNHGTTEHCLNQYNCFKFIHDITKVGGLMIHIVPSWPHNSYTSCFFFMSTAVFDNVAEANGYDRVRLELFDDTNGKYVLAVLRKKKDAPFSVPIDQQYHLPGKTTSS